MSVIPNIAVLKISKKKVYTEEEIVSDILKTLRAFYNTAVDLQHAEEDIQNIETKELAGNSRYNNYKKWVEHEFKTEIKIRTLAKNALGFFARLRAIEESLERSLERYTFQSYPKLRREYDKKIWAEIKELNWLKSGMVKEMHEAEQAIPEEKRWANVFPELAPILKRKYAALYIESIKLGLLITDINHLKGYLEKQKELLES